eukprot:Em0017g508a
MESNYHYEEGVCLPRSTIYEHYQDYCERAQIQPVNAASFGKIIRQQFPTLTTRRLGTRGQSKYHYYGLGIKPTSRYYKKELIEEQPNSGTKKDVELKKEKPSAILSSFPDVNTLKIPESLPKEKLHTFMVMYKTHCQRILDSVVRANFVEVENFLMHFWQGIPTHLLPVLATSLVVDLVAFCDSLLYGVIRDVLIVSPLQSCPESLAQEMVKFSSTLVAWLQEALKGLPESLQSAKYKLASNFARSLKRQTQLMNLAQAARSALHGEDSLMQLRKDWNMMDLQLILANTLFTLERQKISMELCKQKQKKWKEEHQLEHKFLREFAELIESSTTLEDFTMWADSVVDKCVRNAQNTCNLTLKQLGKVFLMTWKYFTSKVAREFTLQSAPSFVLSLISKAVFNSYGHYYHCSRDRTCPSGPFTVVSAYVPVKEARFNLLHILIDDYIVHILESAVEEEEEQVYKRMIDALGTVAEKETVPTRASINAPLNDKDVSIDHPTSCGMQPHRSSMQTVETANHCKDPVPTCPVSSSGHSLSFYVPERSQMQPPENVPMGAMANKILSRGFDGCQTMDVCPSSRSLCTSSSLMPVGNSLLPSLPMNSSTSSISSLSAAGIPFLPALPSVPNMYSYGYTSLSGLAGVPTQPLSAGIFQTQSGLSMPGYPYLPPRFLQNALNEFIQIGDINSYLADYERQITNKDIRELRESLYPTLCWFDGQRPLHSATVPLRTVPMPRVVRFLHCAVLVFQLIADSSGLHDVRSSTPVGKVINPYAHEGETSFSKMWVDLATQVLSNSVAKALVLSTVGSKSIQTSRIAEMFDKFFDCLNASSLSLESGFDCLNASSLSLESGPEIPLDLLTDQARIGR